MEKIEDAKKDFKKALNFNNTYFEKYGTNSKKTEMKKLVAEALDKL